MILIVCALGRIKNVESFIVQVLSFSKKENLVVQAFDATAIYSTDHLISATEHAKRAFQQGTNATNSLALEILLYASGERQIEKALKKIGVTKGQQRVAFVLTDGLNGKRNASSEAALKKKLLQTLHLQSDETAIRGDKETLQRFGITEKELLTTPESHYGDLILEKIALVDVMKK